MTDTKEERVDFRAGLFLGLETFNFSVQKSRRQKPNKPERRKQFVSKSKFPFTLFWLQTPTTEG